jgi:hypothetical protein
VISRSAGKSISNPLGRIALDYRIWSIFPRRYHGVYFYKAVVPDGDPRKNGDPKCYSSIFSKKNGTFNDYLPRVRDTRTKVNRSVAGIAWRAIVAAESINFAKGGKPAIVGNMDAGRNPGDD